MTILYRFLPVVLLLGWLALPGRAQPQSGSTAPYIIFKTTYGFPAGSQKIDESLVTINNKTFRQGIYGSYGRGINLSLGVGKMLNPTFGVEMDAQLLLGNSITADYSSDADSISGSVSSRIRSVLLKPYIVIRNSGDLLSIYTKLGLAIATVSTRYEKEDQRYVSNGQANVLNTESTETAKAKVGFAACFGFSFRVSESISLFVEANGQVMALPVTKGQYTKFTANGKDLLSSMPTSQKSWVYQQSITFDPNEQPNDANPGVKLYNPTYFSYVGIGAGLIYHF